MKKVRQIQKLRQRIKDLEEEMRLNLQKKTSNTPEISISQYRSKIDAARKQLAELA